MFEDIEIKSNSGVYSVQFSDSAQLQDIFVDLASKFFIVDAQVFRLFFENFQSLLSSNRCLLIEATEENKSLERIPDYVDAMLKAGVKRGDRLVAIGGGVIQDITCFLSSTFLRGLDWEFFPTTLLAQCDSCIGSKSSINSRHVKNILGTFNPPRKVGIYLEFLKTLDLQEIRSGIGEMIKVHIIAGKDDFDRLSLDYDSIKVGSGTLLKYIRESLLIKKKFIEEDEFDRGIRNVLNYGHSFGHALESATSYAIPHGIAVSIGMDLANWIANRVDRVSSSDYDRMHSLLFKNYFGYENTKIDLPLFFKALINDKKRTGASSIAAIVPNKSCIPERFVLDIDADKKALCVEFFKANKFTCILE